MKKYTSDNFVRERTESLWFCRSAGENRRTGSDQLSVDHRNHTALPAHYGVRQRAV